MVAASNGDRGMRAVTGKTGAGILLAIAVVLLAQLAGSEPVRKKILDELDVQEGEEVTTIRISLTSRVRYIRHFPYESGEELRIKILLFDVSRDNREAFFSRETLVPFDSKDLPLNEVVYEGDTESGPYLTLFFSRRVDFGVQQGTDSRSIVVYINKSATEISAQPSPDPDEE
jgi:hypothetical protein